MTSFRQQAGEALRTGRVILASSSPRRREILTQLGIIFRVEKPGYDESPVMQELAAPYDVPVFQKWLFRSRLKKKLAEVILGKYHSLPSLPDQLIFCFDTVVHDDRRVMGKPGSHADAAQMLRHLNGTSHSVTTVCLAALNHTRQLAYFSTRVQFRKLRAEDIQEYLNDENVLDAAGAYKIQEKGLRLVNQIAGPYHNVVGLPIEFVTRFRD